MRKVLVELQPAEYRTLAEMAEREDRPVHHQATRLLKAVLRNAAEAEGQGKVEDRPGAAADGA